MSITVAASVLALNDLQWLNDKIPENGWFLNFYIWNQGIAELMKLYLEFYFKPS